MKDGTVLLVDDEPVVLQIHAAAVRHFGFEAIIAESAGEATDLVRKHRPSLIISDIQMPGEGGFDFLEGLGRSGLKNMPAIYLTGYDDIEIVRGGLRAGGDDFIIKGGPVERLKRRVAFWMTSGFTELPADLRRRALKAANIEKGDEFGGVEQNFIGREKLIQRVLDQLTEELVQMPDGYGERLVERVCFMGRLSNLVIGQSSSFGDFVRFPEHLDTVVRQLDVSWAHEMWPLFKRFEDWACDPRFVLSGVEALKPFSDYDWFDEGMR
jgi:DNA-binding response OmpR family regulator